jgi:hypothetical protein
VNHWSRSIIELIVGRFRPTSFNLPWITAGLTVFAALLYLLLRIIANQFYMPLGLTVEDVGLDQVPTLVRSAFGVFFIAFIYGAAWLAFLLGIVLALVTGIRESVTSGETRPMALLPVIVLVLLLFGTFTLGTWLYATGGELRTVLGATITVSSAMCGLGVMIGSMMQSYPRSLVGLAVVSLVLLISYGFWTFAKIARDDAHAVLSGQAPYTDFEKVPLMPYRAQIAYVTLDGARTAKDQRCVLYLGDSGRRVVAYDPGARRVRLLRAHAEVSILPGRRRCPSTLRLLTTQARASSAGQLRLRVGCGPGNRHCDGTLAIASGSHGGSARASKGPRTTVTLARGHIAVSERATKTVVIQLTRGGRHLLRDRRRIRATAQIGGRRRALTILAHATEDHPIPPSRLPSGPS